MCELDKKDKIVNAFLSELNEHGYAACNTNKVAEAAGVSKGLLFHYYKSKENLMITISEEALEKLYLFFKEFDTEGLTLVQAIKKYTQYKAEFLYAEPQFYRLITTVLFGLPAELKQKLEPLINKVIGIARERISAHLARENLRSGVKITDATDLIFSILRIISDKYAGIAINNKYSKDIVESMIKDFYSYFDIIMKGIIVG
jgi:AcrR family transcriptional regulator